MQSPEGPQEFRPVFGYEGSYEVDSYGNVYSNLRGSVRKRLKPQLYTNNDTTYAYVNLYRKGKMQSSSIHRIVAKAFLGHYKDLEVNHKDLNTLNNRYDNLEWCTRQYNIEYSQSKTYKVIDPTGIVVTIFNLEKFCRDNSLNASNLHKVIVGKRNKCHGWTTFHE